MTEIFINQPELLGIEQIRAALSEETLEAREKAVKLIKHDILAVRLSLLNDEYGPDWLNEPENAELVLWMAVTAAERHEAVHEFSEVKERYEKKNERKLNVAEHIGRLIWLSIQDEKFEGVHTDGGILRQVCDEAKEAKVRGARDKDVVRKIWNVYRGVVHLGMAITYCEENPSQNLHVLHLAELFRKTLSENCPKGTSKPYVDQGDQISFVYISTASGPRFRNRGLPFGVN